MARLDCVTGVLEILAPAPGAPRRSVETVPAVKNETAAEALRVVDDPKIRAAHAPADMLEVFEDGLDGQRQLAGKLENAERPVSEHLGDPLARSGRSHGAACGILRGSRAPRKARALRGAP